MKNNWKKSLTALLCGFIAISAGSFVACNGASEPPPNDPGQQQPGDPVALTTPSIRLSQGKATWQQDPNATGYEYQIDEATPVVTQNLFVSLTEGQSCKVRALGDGEMYLDSAWSNTVKWILTKLDRPEVNISGGKAVWTAIPNASGYMYKIDDGVEQFTENLFVTLQAGQSIQVKAVGDGYEYKDGNWSFADTFIAVEVEALVNIAGAGTVTGAGSYGSGDEVMLTATANEGYEFVRWSDGDTNATRTIVVEGDITLTAIFAAKVYEITATADATEGTVTGVGSYAYGSTVVLTAVPNEGYHFVKWSDNSTSATLTFTATENKQLTAVFAINTYTISVSSDDTAKGTVAGGDTYEHGDEVTLTATAKEGYVFAGWYEGNQNVSTNAIYTFTATKNVTLTAKFALGTCSVSVSSTDTTKGTVTVNGAAAGTDTYDYGTTITLTATPNTGYKFVSWSDGDTNATKTFKVQGDVTLTATFEIKTYTVTLISSNTAMGMVTGAATYNHGDVAVIKAIPTDEKYKFVSWSDGVDLPIRNITVTSNMTLTATFADQTYTIAVNKTPAGVGTITGAGTIKHGESATLTATTTNSDYLFKGWYDGDDLLWADTSYTVSNVKADINLTAVWELNAVVLTLASDFDIAGTLDGAGTYKVGDVAQMMATPNNKYTFLGWYNEAGTLLSSAPSFTYKVNTDTTITAKWRDDWKSVSGYNYWTFDQLGNDVLPIVGFNTPNASTAELGRDVYNAYGDIPSQVTDNSYRLMSESGVNVACGWWNDWTNTSLHDEILLELDYADKYGMVYIVNNRESLYATKASDFDLYSEYMDKPAYGGTITIDEPGAVNFRDVKNSTAVWKSSKYSNTLAYVNMLPNYADYTWQLQDCQGTGGTWDGEFTDYGSWVDLYLKTCSPQVFSYDYYPYLWDGQNRFGGNWVPGSGWYSNLSCVRYYTTVAGVPFWVYGQVGTWQEGMTTEQQQQMAGNNTTRKLTYAEMAVQYNSMLAYGAKGIEYYNYFMPVNYTKKADVTACVDVKGNPTIYYDMVKRINKQALAAGKYLLRCSWKGVLTIGNSSLSPIPENDKPYDNNQVVNYYGATAKTNAVTGSGDAIVGCFEYRDIGWVYYISSNSTSQGATVTLNLNGTYNNMTLVQNGAESKKSGNSVTVELPAGEGALVVVPKN